MLNFKAFLVTSFSYRISKQTDDYTDQIKPKELLSRSILIASVFAHFC